MPLCPHCQALDVSKTQPHTVLIVVPFQDYSVLGHLLQPHNLTLTITGHWSDVLKIEFTRNISKNDKCDKTKYYYAEIRKLEQKRWRGQKTCWLKVKVLLSTPLDNNLWLKWGISWLTSYECFWKACLIHPESYMVLPTAFSPKFHVKKFSLS